MIAIFQIFRSYLSDNILKNLSLIVQLIEIEFTIKIIIYSNCHVKITYI